MLAVMSPWLHDLLSTALPFIVDTVRRLARLPS
jgi:hypothetical protein